MEYNEIESRDHQRILSKLDENRSIWTKINELASLERDVLLLNERIMEMKQDKEKSVKQSMWIIGMAFTVIMAVAGSAINQNATVKVLQEKVAEQKMEIAAVKKYANDLEDWVDYNFCLLYTSPSPRDATLSRMPSSA